MWREPPELHHVPTVVRDAEIHPDADLAAEARVDHSSPRTSRLREGGARAAMQTPERLGVARDRHGRDDLIDGLVDDLDPQFAVESASGDGPTSR